MNMLSPVLVVNWPGGTGRSVNNPKKASRPSRQKRRERDREASSNDVIVNIKGVVCLKNYQQIFAHHVCCFPLCL